MKAEKKMSGSWAVAAAAVGLLMLGCALLPFGLFAQLDAASFQGALPRQRTAGRLAATAEDIYLVRAVHARSERQQNAGQAAPVSSAISLREVQADLAGLQEAGVWPEELLREVEALLAGEGAAFTQTDDRCGAILVRCHLAEEAKFSFAYEKEEVTGTVLRMWELGALPEWPGEEPAPSQALESYTAYCGLGGIGDWQEVGGYYAAATQSGDAKLLLYYNNPFAFGLAAKL